LPIKPPTQLDPDAIELAGLQPGLYRAEVSANTPEGVLGSQAVEFARLGPRFYDTKEAGWPGRGFGVAITELSEQHLADHARLIDLLGIQWVKVPVWLLESMQSKSEPAVVPRIEAYLRELGVRGHEAVGWIGPDARRAARRHGTGSLIDVLSAPPTTWRPSLAYAWSSYGGLIRWWQIGDELDASVVADPRLTSAVAGLREQMSGVIRNPLLVVPGNVLAGGTSALTGAGGTPLAAAIAAHLPSSIPAESITEYRPDFTANGPDGLWLTIEPLPLHRYPRLPRATDLTKRLVLAKAAGAAAVFLRQPWETSETGAVWPTEEYLILRTVADLLGGAAGVGTVAIDGQVESFVFEREGRAIMATWDDYAPLDGYEHWMLLEPDAKQIDPWGRITRLTGSGNEYPVRIGPVPTFVGPLPRWQSRFAQAFAIDPPNVEAAPVPHERVIRFLNPFPEPVSGEVRLIPPPGWEVRPSVFQFALRPGQEHDGRVTIRFPPNESAGTKAILSEFRIDAGHTYRLRIPAWIELGLQGIDVETVTQRSGNRVVVRQSITNHTPETVSFYGYLTVPNREPIRRMIGNLQSGQTITREYEVDEASQLTGHRMRLCLREVGGQRIWNRIVDVP
jgi:hypothetical protein